MLGSASLRKRIQPLPHLYICLRRLHLAKTPAYVSLATPVNTLAQDSRTRKLLFVQQISTGSASRDSRAFSVFAHIGGTRAMPPSSAQRRSARKRVVTSRYSDGDTVKSSPSRTTKRQKVISELLFRDRSLTASSIGNQRQEYKVWSGEGRTTACRRHGKRRQLCQRPYRRDCKTD